MRILSSCCLLASALCLTAAAQQAPATAPATASRPAIKKPAQEIVLPVSVRDKHGNLVQGLTAADFTLTEDGRPQTITSLSQNSTLPLQLGILIDTSGPVLPAMGAERKAAEKFLELMLPDGPNNAKPAGQAFLIHFDNEVELLEDFTNSRQKLNGELEQIGPTGRARENPDGPETRDSGGRPQVESQPSHGGTQLYDAIYLASDELMKPKPGRKALVVFSDGVDRSSKETQSEAIDAAERANTIVYTIYFRGGQERQSGLSGLGRHGGGYPGGGYPGGGYPGGGYPGGGYPGGGYPGGGGNQRAPIDGKKVMQDIATRTGGQFFEAKKSAEFDDIYNQVAQNLHGQYVLTYTTDQPDIEGGYHKIVLKPKRDDLTVITRQGYYAPGGDSK